MSISEFTYPLALTHGRLAFPHKSRPPSVLGPTAMTPNPVNIPPAVPALRERRKGFLQARPSRLAKGSSTLVRDRLDSFATAFLADERPGLIFEYGRLVFANNAARSLLGSTSASDEFVEALSVCACKGVVGRGLVLRTRSGVFAPVLHPSRNHQGHPTRICFLIRESESAAAYQACWTPTCGISEFDPETCQYTCTYIRGMDGACVCLGQDPYGTCHTTEPL